MADEDELEYLQPGFDPASLTVARLRGILVQHDIPYASSAKKPELISIFNEQLVPRSRKILSARSRTTRTSKGITDMPSSQESTVNGDEEEEHVAPVAETPRRRIARSSRHSTAETAEATPGPRKTPIRKKASVASRASDVEPLPEEPRTATRKSRSSVQPVVKVEEPDTPPRRQRARESVFSDDNPFQSGSSPADDDDRRRSSGMRGEKRKSSSRKRRTASPSVKDEDGDLTVSASRSARSRHSQVKIEPGEEFTPEEQQELEHEEPIRTVARRHKATERRGIGSAIWALLAAITIGYGFLWRREKLELGFCGVGKQISALEEFEAPEWLAFLQPDCEPCPLHASCYSDLRVECDADFVLKSHPLSLGGAIPLPPTCEPDGEKVRKVHAVAEKAVEELRERRAQFECGELTETSGKPATAVEIDEPQLKAQVSQKRRRGMSEAEFEELWKGAIGEIVSRDEVTSGHSGLDATVRLSSSSLARLPLRCALRRSARLTLARYRVEAAGAVALLALILFVRNYIRNLRRDTARVPELVSTTLDRLATQAAMHNQGSRSEPWVSAGRLRDDVLRAEFSTKRREEIWRRVQKVVETNANVRSSVREDRNGEVSRVWEWIGSFPALDDASGQEQQRSGRPSSLGDRVATPDGASDRKWDAGRPYY